MCTCMRGPLDRTFRRASRLFCRSATKPRRIIFREPRRVRASRLRGAASHLSECNSSQDLICVVIFPLRRLRLVRVVVPVPALNNRWMTTQLQQPLEVDTTGVVKQQVHG